LLSTFIKFAAAENSVQLQTECNSLKWIWFRHRSGNRIYSASYVTPIWQRISSTSSDIKRLSVCVICGTCRLPTHANTHARTHTHKPGRLYTKKRKENKKPDA